MVVVGWAVFARSCRAHPARTAQWHAQLLYLIQPHLREIADAAVLRAKVSTLWRWAQSRQGEDLGEPELRRLADRVGSSWKDGEGKYRELRGLFGVGHGEVLGWEGFSGACRVHAGEAELWFELLRLRLPRRRPGCCCRGQAE